jgi:hypothetical protein
MSSNKTFASLFRWVVIIGILQDWVLGIPGIFVPNTVLGLIGQPPPAQPVWPAFASLLVVLLSLFYFQPAFDPLRYRVGAILTVAARAGGVVFFLVIWRDQAPPLLGYIDLTFTIVQGALLWLTFREGQSVVGVQPGQQATA